MFDGISFAVNAQDPMDMGVPGLSEARQVFVVAEPLFAGDERSAMMDFEKPSNGVFQPLEYRSTNCCVCIIIYPRSVLRNFDDGGETEVVCICAPDPSPPPRPEASVGVDPIQVRPKRTGGNSGAMIAIATSNIPQGTAVSIELQPWSNGGHLAHTGMRLLGTVTPQSGENHSEGLFLAKFTASEFGGDVRIVATVGELRYGATIQVRVPNLSRVTAGDGYKMWGSKAVHPVGWYATSGMKTKLKNIGKAYEKSTTQTTTVILQPNSCDITT